MKLFFTANRKSIIPFTIIMTLSGVLLWVMIFYLINKQDPGKVHEINAIILSFIVLALGMPLITLLITSINWIINHKRFNQNIEFLPYKEFFVNNEFKSEWINTDSYWHLSKLVMVGHLNEKMIICAMNKKFDFIITSLNEKKVRKSIKIFELNFCKKENIRFWDDQIFVSFKKKKSLRSNYIENRIKELIEQHQ
jgi:hypothetical protein